MESSSWNCAFSLPYLSVKVGIFSKEVGRIVV